MNDQSNPKYTVLLIDDESDQLDKIKKIIEGSISLQKIIKSVDTRLVDPKKGAGEVSKEIRDNPARWNIILADLFMPTPEKGGLLIAGALIPFFEEDAESPVRLIFISNKTGAGLELLDYIPRFRWIEWYPKSQSTVPDGFERDDLAPDSLWSYAIAKAIVKLNEDAVTERVSTIEDLEVGLSGRMRIARTEAERIAEKATKTTNILICGDSGTGKEVFAEFIHRMSCFNMGSFVKVNSAAFPETLIESELFGYKKGAFAEAYRDKKGKFDDAQNGVIFLDEIGDIPPQSQAKLLRVLGEGRDYCPVGGEAKDNKTFNGVIICATNKPIEEMGKDQFRKDLYYRIGGNVIRLSPLKERKDDIIPLAKHLIKKLSEKMKLSGKPLSNDAENLLQNYEWPGNVRELENAISRALIIFDTEELTPSDFPINLSKVTPVSDLPEINLASLPPDKFVTSIKGIHLTTLMSNTGLDEDTIKEKVKAGLKILYKKSGENITNLSKILDISRVSFYQDYLPKWKLTVNDIKDTPFR